jgi:hypothetical protein
VALSLVFVVAVSLVEPLPMVRTPQALHRMPGSSWRAWLTCLVLALLLPAPYDGLSFRLPASGFAVAESETASVCLSTNSSFRLGNAARPLGWSTAIADFNVDGAPDIAIADRVYRSAAGYSYRIQLSISGELTDAVTFESPDEAIQLRVSDVDADNDLDLVASAVLSKDIVGVWLNDGHGRFTSTAVRQMPAAIGARQVLDSTDPSSSPASVGYSPRRTDGGIAVRFRDPPSSVRLGSFVARDAASGCSLSGVSVPGPRAPPPPHFLIS